MLGSRVGWTSARNKERKKERKKKERKKERDQSDILVLTP